MLAARVEPKNGPGREQAGIGEYIYLYGAVSPQDGTSRLSDHADFGHRLLSGFPRHAIARIRPAGISLVLDGAPNHRSGQLVVPNNVTLFFLPPCVPELNPKENLRDEIREKIFKNHALKSIDKVCQKLTDAILYIERNPQVVKSITSFPYIAKSF